MVLVTGTVYKQTKEQKCGISFQRETLYDPIVISRIRPDGLFASSALAVGMQVLRVNEIPVDHMSSSEAIQLIKDAEGRVSVAAENRTLAVAEAVCINAAPVMGYIIMKKVDKSYSFHGPMTYDMVNLINDKLQTLKLVHGANRLRFSLNDNGHFYAAMNSTTQKVHEEDFMVVILETMELVGWCFRFQYDKDIQSYSTVTRKEVFIFHRTSK